MKAVSRFFALLLVAGGCATHMSFAPDVQLVSAVSEFQQQQHAWPKSLDDITIFASTRTDIKFDRANYSEMVFREQVDGSLIIDYKLTTPDKGSGRVKIGPVTSLPNKITGANHGQR